MARVTVGQFKNRGQMVRNQRKRDEEEKKTSNRSNNKPKNNSNRNLKTKDNDNARDSLSVPRSAVRIAGREVKEGYQGAAVKYNNLVAGDGVNVGRGTLGAHQHNGLIRQKGTNDRRTGTELKRNEQINQKLEKTQNNIKDLSKKAGKQDEKAVAKSQKETEKIRENTTKDMSGFGKWAFNTAVAGMEMLPDLAIGALLPEVAIGKRLMGAEKLGRKAATKIDDAATSFLKTTPMGVRAGGSDYIQQKRDGKTEAQAQVHGTGTGIIEQITEMLGGNLGLSKALGKGIVGTGAKTLKGRVAKNAFEEGMEEVAADYLSPILDRITGDKDALGQYKTSDFHMQALQDFASGAVLSTVLGAPGVIKSGVKARNLTEEDNERILKKGLAQPEDSDAFQYAKNIMDRKANGESISSNEMYNLAGVVSEEEAINGIKYSGIYNKVKENRARDVEQLRGIEKSFNSQEIDIANEYTDKLINDVKSNFKDVNDTLANSMARVAVGAGTLSDAIEVSEASLEDRQKFMQFTGVQLPTDNNAAFRSAVVEMTYNNNIDYGLRQRDIVESEVDRINGGKFVFSKEGTEIQNPHLVNAHDSKIMRDYVAELSDSEADSYIAGYESGDVAAYTKAYDAYRRAGRSGVEFTNAREINSAHVINTSVARNAWSTGRKVRAEEKVKKQKREEARKAEYEKHKNSPLYGKLDRMSDEDRVTLNAILSQKGLTAEIVEDIEDVNGNKRSISSANANSFINLANGKITIKESVNAIQALLHEIWHYENAVNPKDVNKTNEAMKDFYIQKFGKKAWDKLVKEKAGAYNGILEDTKEFEEEIYCDMVAGIFSTKKGVNQFADWLTNESNYTTAEQKTILQQLLDIVNKVAKAVSNLVNDKKALSGITSEMREVFRKSERNANELRKQILDILNNNVNTSETAFNIGDIKFSLAEQQLDIINTYNPMLDDYHTGIRSTDDIHTLEEALQDSEYENWREDGFPYPDITSDLMQNALDSGHITVYSSYPIDQGVFVTPSKMMADEYAGNIPGRPAQTPVYSKTVNLDEVAWITPEEGQYANANAEASADNNLYKNGYTAQDLLGEPDVKFSFGEAGTFFGAYARQGKTSMDVVKGKVKARGPKNGIKNPVLESGESVLRRVMMENIKKNQGKDFVKEDAKKEIENVVSFMREMNDMFSEFGKQYTFVNFDEIKNASIDVRRNHDGTCSATMTSMIKNGEYPINFDFTTICKKRGPLMQVIEGLTEVSEKGKNLALTPEQLLDINNALRKEGVETACLGCFVEARRYHMVSYTDKVCNLWNSLVDEYAKQHGIKVEDIEDFNFSRGENATEENFQAAADTFFNYKNDKSGKGNPTDRFKLIIKHGGDTYLKHLRPADLVTPNGLKGIKSLSTNEKDLFGMLKSAYGTAAPKETIKYVPYNSEIALLPKTKDKKPFVKYLESIGGIRTQSFSDFLIQNAFDYMQMVADMAARNFPAHAYTKELAFAKIFGQTGIKINMSVMFDVWNGKQWADAIGCSEERGNELARKYAGLQFFKNEDEIPDSFRDDNGNVRRNHIREVEIDGTHGYITYLVGDQARSDRVWQQTYEDAISAGKAPEIAEEIANEGRKWVQSIDLKEAVTLENTEGYADNVGIIGVGTSDEAILLMLDDKDFPFIIPYHASGMPGAVKRLTNLMFATNYESTQNARILNTITDENGNELGTNYPNELFEKLGDWKAVWSEINNNIANGWKVEGRGPKKNSEGKVIEKDANGNPYELHGVGGYDIYADLKNGYSPRETANRYLEDCGKNGLLPVFYQFASHENYYKLLFDYSVTNLVSGETSPQGAVKNQYPGYNANTGEGNISELKKICEEEAAARNADMEKQNRVANDLVNKKAIEFGLIDDNESDVKFSMDETNARYVDESRGRRNSTLSAAKRNAGSITNSIYEQTKKYTDTDIIRSNVKDIISPYLEGINRNERSNRVDTVMWAVQKAALDIRNNDIDVAWETLFDASTYIVDNATMIDDSAYVEYEMLRQYLRKTAIKVPKHVQNDIPDYGEWRKRNMGRIKFKNDGANIDSVYIELNEQFPELFPEDIVNQADQLMRMSDVWDKIKPMPISFSDAEVGEISMNITNMLIDYAASDGIFKKVKQYNQLTDGAIDYLKEHAKANRINLNDILEAAGVKSIKQMSKEQYMEAVRTIDEVAKIRKQIKEQNTDNADIGFGPFNGTQEEIKEVLDEIRTKIRNEVDKARGDATTEDIGFGKFEGDQDAFIEMQAEIERRRTHRAIQQQHVEDIKQAFKDEGYDFDEVLSNAKNKSTISSNDNTPARFLEKSLGFKEGKLLSELIIENSGKSEAEGIKWLNGMRDLIKSVAKEYKIKAGSKEDAAAQMYGEGFYVNEAGDFVEYGDAELAADFPDKTVQERIKGLAKDQRIRQAYDETLSLINDVYTRNGYETIGRLDNYFLHFMMPNDILTKIGFPFNPFDMKSKDLPTNLNGITADLKPGRPYFSSNMHRKGNKTTYSVLMGFERYMESAKNQIYHIDDIQKLRGLRTYLAETFGQEHGLDNIENMSEEEINVRIDEMYNKRHLSTFAAFLNEQANILAGKTSLIDRGLEGKIGRRGLTMMSAISAQVSSNMVGANISSSLTNFISLTQAFSTTSKVDFLKAIVDYTIGIFNKDTFVEDNDFLVRRLMDKGATFKTPWAKITDAGFIFMSATDKICAEVITRAKFNEFKRKGLSDSEAHNEAGRAAARILGDRSLGMMPHLYNAKSLSFLTKFQLEVRNQLDVMTWDIYQNANADVADIENALKRNSKKAAKITSQVFQLIIVQNIFGGIFKELFGYNPCFDIISLILAALGFEFDDDDDFNPVDFTKIKKNNNTVQDNLTDSFEELLSMLPYTSVLSGGRIPLANALPISELAKGEDQFGNKKSRLETIIGALPYYLMPTGYNQLYKKTFNGLMMFREGQAEGYGSYTKSGNLRFSLEKTPFNVIQAGVAGQWASNAAQEYINSLDAPSANEALKGTKGNVTEYNGETYRKSADGKWTKDTTGRYLSEDSVDFYNAKSKAQKKAEAENATEEEILQSKYLNSMGYQISELQKEYKETDGDKSGLESEIDRLSNEAIDGYKNVSAGSTTATVNGVEFYKDDEGKWHKKRESTSTASKSKTSSITKSSKKSPGKSMSRKRSGGHISASAPSPKSIGSHTVGSYTGGRGIKKNSGVSVATNTVKPAKLSTNNTASVNKTGKPSKTKRVTVAAASKNYGKKKSVSKKKSGVTVADIKKSFNKAFGA